MQGLGPDAVDEVEIDFSPLRAPQDVTDSLSERADTVAAELEGMRVDADESTVNRDMEAGEEGQGDNIEVGKEDEDEDEDDDWVGDDLSKAPIWRLPVVSRVSSMVTRGTHSHTNIMLRK